MKVTSFLSMAIAMALVSGCATNKDPTIQTSSYSAYSPAITTNPYMYRSPSPGAMSAIRAGAVGRR